MNSTSAVNSLRRNIKDSATSKFVTEENLSEWVDGISGRKSFQLVEFQQHMGGLVASLVEVRADDAVVTASLTSPEAGIITLSAAPQNTLYASYFYQFFSDDDLIDFLNQALLLLRDYTTLAQVPKGLESALLSFASGLCYGALAGSAALLVLKEVEGSKADFDKVSEKYRKLSVDAEAAARRAMAYYYADVSGKVSPSLGIGSSFGNISW